MPSRPSMLSITLFLGWCIAASANPITLTLRTRDPKTSELKTAPLKIDPRKAGIVIVDPWNYHWCMTWTEQAGGMTPRMNKALECVRKLGMPVFWGPTDTASTFSGWPQRQRAMAVPYLPVPKVRGVACRWTVGTGPCLCGPGIACQINYGFDGMDERLTIAKDDFIVSGTQELYSLCKSRGLTHLIYFGGATNICLTGKDVGLGPMHAAGIDCVFARDLAFAWTHYNPVAGHTPTTGNAQAADDLERAGIATVVMADELRKLRLWDDAWITEPVRITPGGKPARPYFFEESVSVSLDLPFVERADIRYTLDGSEPTGASPRYERPIALAKTTTLRAATFRGDQKVALDNSGYFVRLPAMPPKPEVELGQLTPVTDLYATVSPAAAACLWHPVANQSYEGKPLRIRGTKYAKGFGMRAPAYLRYDLKPEFSRFVALAGVDDNMLDRELGRSIAMYPSVVFKVFIDGKLAAESPVMRISQVPWRFDVPILPGSRQIVLVCDDSGAHSPYNLGNWVSAGFVKREK
jgi:hypothetical protein